MEKKEYTLANILPLTFVTSGECSRVILTIKLLTYLSYSRRVSSLDAKFLLFIIDFQLSMLHYIQFVEFSNFLIYGLFDELRYCRRGAAWRYFLGILFSSACLFFTFFFTLNRRRISIDYFFVRMQYLLEIKFASSVTFLNYMLNVKKFHLIK